MVGVLCLEDEGAECGPGDGGEHDEGGVDGDVSCADIGEDIELSDTAVLVRFTERDASAHKPLFHECLVPEYGMACVIKPIFGFGLD